MTSGRKTKLSKELIKQVSASIEAGAWDYVAAESAGIAQSTFYLWLQQAEAGTDDPLLIEFSEAIERARATARTNAENRVFAEKPDVWLLRGPGRQSAQRPGWSSESTVTVNAGDAPIKLTWSGDSETTTQD